MVREQRVDVEALDEMEKRRLAKRPHCTAAERMGIAVAFEDIDKHGFAYAHEWAERIQGDATAQTYSFMTAYKQAVYGYWLAF